MGWLPLEVQTGTVMRVLSQEVVCYGIWGLLVSDEGGKLDFQSATEFEVLFKLPEAGTVPVRSRSSSWRSSLSDSLSILLCFSSVQQLYSWHSLLHLFCP